MKKLFMILMMAAALMTLASCSQKPGVIKTDVPARPAGQESVIGLTAEPIDVVRVGFVGLGMRGYSAVDRFVHVPHSKIAALCDVEPDRVGRSADILERNGLEPALMFSVSL